MAAVSLEPDAVRSSMSSEEQPDRPALAADVPSDVDLMERIRGGDGEALDELLRRHWNGVVAYAARLLGDRDAAADVAQKTFLRVWQKATKWAPSGSVPGYILRIARNLALNEQRSRRVVEAFAARQRRQPAAWVVTPLEVTQERQLRAAVEGVLEGLPERRREAFVLARYQNLSHQEIAEVMGISPQTVANHLSAALATLRQSLRAYLDRE